MSSVLWSDSFNISRSSCVWVDLDDDDNNDDDDKDTNEDKDVDDKNGDADDENNGDADEDEDEDEDEDDDEEQDDVGDINANLSNWYLYCKRSASKWCSDVSLRCLNSRA